MDRRRRPSSAEVRSLAMTVIAALTLMGCAGPGHIFRTFDLENAESLSVDARQRMVLVTHRGGKSRDRTVVCAEPSPDVFSAQAAHAAANASFAQGPATPGADGAPQSQRSAVGSGSSGINESAATIAMRTQTIQLLRDGLFRACEAYMNGAIDQHQYNIILLNMDKLTITMMGMDAIGGTATVPPATISAGSSTSDRPATSTERPATGQVQSEAVANIVQHTTRQSSLPALCVSLLASGELRVDNPGQQAILARCDELLGAAVDQFVSRPPPHGSSYRISRDAAGLGRTVSTAPTAPPARLASGWSTRVQHSESSAPWDVIVEAGEPEEANTSRASSKQQHLSWQNWDTRIERHVAADARDE